MQLINFWILVLAFITAGNVNALTDDDFPLAFVVSSAGLVATFAFQRLERRTRQLVKVSEDALESLQHELAAVANCDELQMVRRVAKTPPLTSYGQIVLLLHGFAFLAFLGAAGYSLSRWLG